MKPAKPTWSIVRKSNFDHDDHRGNEWFAAEKIPHEYFAKKMCDALNANASRYEEDYFVVVPGDYQLPPDWEP